MAEKIDFLRQARADYVCTQLPIESARWLYADCGAEVLAMPHALNPARYHPPDVTERPVDVGFIGSRFRYFIGDVERSRMIDAVRAGAPGWGLTSDFQERNIGSSDWARFLRSCKGTVGAESGTYYLDRQGALVAGAKSFEEKHPDVSFEELHARFFARPTVDYRSGKALSSRHFEAIGTKTCQILLEGHYNGLLEPEIHYIAVKKDLSDIDEAVERFRDASYREQIVDRAFEYAMDSHTHAHRVGALLSAVGTG
jgi:hypothetical protein